MAKPAKLTYKVKRVRGESFAGIPLWSLEERRGSRVTRRWHGTKAEMSDLAKRARAASRRQNPAIKPGKWIKAQAVRIRREAGRLVMDIKKKL